MPAVAKTKGAVTKPARESKVATKARPAKTTRRAAGPAKAVVRAPSPSPSAAASKAKTAPAGKPAPAPQVAKLPEVARKPKQASRPSLPLPPPPPPPPAHRDELLAPRDIGRLLRYGEQFGAHKIDVRMLPLQLPSSSGALAVADPAVAKSWRVFDRPVGAGASSAPVGGAAPAPARFRVMLSVARSVEKGRDIERLAAVVIHVGRPPIERWTVAHYRGARPPRTVDQLPRVSVTSGSLVLVDGGDGSPGVIAVPAPTGVTPVEIPLTDGRSALALPCGNGEFAAYWAIDAADKPVCLVLDFDVFTQKDWKSKPH